MKKTNKIICVIVIPVILLLTFTACKTKSNTVTDIIALASGVAINGEAVDTVEARMGAFQGSHGDYIEFFFSEPQTINTVHIIEKTTSVRQFNVYADENGKYKLIYTGKTIFNDNIPVEEITTTAVKITVLNTEIGNDNFIIQGVTAYNITDKGE